METINTAAHSNTIKIESVRIAGEWHATAFIGKERVAFAVTKNRKLAEEDARKGAEYVLRDQRRFVTSEKFVSGLQPFLQQSAA
ncbi:hypothetical protein [Hymenobacter fodinae]|uniref:Uncharacterized protein n=1 Tax=Hymenobacter fodinae TaxID=2510796 RepID=A0A4Z0P8J9_9BACT|nr:hypothetical protein [Hymenobacter fodinae]TGE08278.1 hypothetical protein EU556_11190 [Hymenobacter fodinae]